MSESVGQVRLISSSLWLWIVNSGYRIDLEWNFFLWFLLRFRLLNLLNLNLNLWVLHLWMILLLIFFICTVLIFFGLIYTWFWITLFFNSIILAQLYFLLPILRRLLLSLVRIGIFKLLLLLSFFGLTVQIFSWLVLITVLLWRLSPGMRRLI